MKKSHLFGAVCASLLILISFSSQAAVLTWTLNNVIFDDGGTAIGTFDYDVDAGVDGTYSNINITTAGGTSGFSGANYSLLRPLTFPGDVFLATISGSPIIIGTTTALSFGFDGFLSNAGGTIPILSTLGSIELTCGVADCSLSIPPQRVVLKGGSVSAVPIPAAVWLFGSGLVGLVGLARRKKAV